MDIVFLDKQQNLPASTQLLHSKLENIRNAFLHAIHRAILLKREILVSFTYTVPTYTPLHVYNTFATLNLRDRLYWEQPGEQKAFVGAETVATIETHGAARFHEAAKNWQSLQDGAIVENMTQQPESNGLLLLGGFAFDPQRPATELWDGFGDGRLTLPRLLYTTHHGQATLSLNVLVSENDTEEQLTQENVNKLLTLEHALQQMPHANIDTDAEEPVTGKLSIQNLMDAEAWKELVGKAVRMIQHNDYKKIVLARGVQVTHSNQHFSIADSLQRLRTSYPGAYVFAIERGEQTFIGATPERLLQANDGQIQTMALAGSAPRGETAEEDKRLGAELAQSAKNREEHAIVVQMIQEALDRHCEKVWIAETPQLLRLKNIQHLATPIVGKLREGDSALAVIADLYPTPAVGGFPREAALEAIRTYEELDRGWYAGPVGWIDAAGNGEFAVALRCALVEKERATLFAGCGIVADSQPESEYAESCWKLKVMLRGLGAEE
ncbi:MAG TPA: isochorismate synthase [Ktedonobacteraceae bacterium]|jgi:isochorismate synthase|nr:isochorismate synthase [Ktedonobacteraceae bacterium]